MFKGARICAGLTALLLGAMASAQTDMLMHHNNRSRTGENLSEKILTTANVSANTFGKLFERPVDGRMFAQPLVVSNLSIPDKGTHNVLYVCSAHNTVYAYDADDPSVTQPYWSRNLGPSVPSEAVNQGSVFPEVGIISTPVIKKSTNTMYVVAYTLENERFIYRLHALDIATGEERPNSPIEIKGQVNGTGDGSVNGHLQFDPRQQMQRPALGIFANQVIICFGSHEDHNPYHGWIFAVHSEHMKIQSLYCLTRNSGRGAIWQSGQGPAGDDRFFYVVTGNGSFTPDGKELGSSFVKMGFVNGKLAKFDWFTPYNASFMNTYDQDLGNSGCVLIPGTNYILGGGKTSVLYLLNSNRMGHFNSDRDDVVQSWLAGNGHIHGCPVFYSGATGAFIYLWSEQDRIKQFRFLGNSFETTPASVGSLVLPDEVMPGGFLTVSANGSRAGTAIVWANHANYPPGSSTPYPGELHAYDAADLSHELWNSYMNQPRDDYGNFAKFMPPTVVNGKVYVGTYSNKVVVYGLLPGAP